MPKLYPPQIAGTLPAFYEASNLIVPFTMNQTVGWNDFDYFCIKIKNILNNELIGTLQSSKPEEKVYSISFNASELVDHNLISSGNFYKIQLCYVKQLSETKKEFGYYSTVGVIKYTTEPEVIIENLDSAIVQNHIYTYIGKYSQQGKDTTEKVYSYNFTIYDDKKEIFETSGEQLHNHENNDSVYASSDSYTLIKALEEDKIYTIVYTITTANGIVKSSNEYSISQDGGVSMDTNISLAATMNEENGYVHLQMFGEKKNEKEQRAEGTFLICRSSSEDNFATWVEMHRFALFNEFPSNYDWKDFTVQHGYTYKYSLQQYSQVNSIYSFRTESNYITANFEHSFLYDGKRQLKIKYNPKIGALKETLLESKTNTLGGKYPFFFKNGNVGYKEFSISGLVSYLADEEQLFLQDKDMFLEDLSYFYRKHSLNPEIDVNDSEYFNNMEDLIYAYKLKDYYAERAESNSQENQIIKGKIRATNLTDYNILAERIFKIKVLEFLNDEQPKLFRSPGEGNYLVRLMNSSLAPNDQLSRMLHTFSTTATEIDDSSYEKLNKYSLISIEEPKMEEVVRDVEYDLSEFLEDSKNAKSFQLYNSIVSINCRGMKNPENITLHIAYKPNQYQAIYMGDRQNLTIDFDEVPYDIQIRHIGDEKIGKVEIKYKGKFSNTNFDKKKKGKRIDFPILQIKGEAETISAAKDIFDYIKDKLGVQPNKYFNIQFVKNPFATEESVYEYYISDGNQSENRILNSKVVIEDGEYSSIPTIKITNGVMVNLSVSASQN